MLSFFRRMREYVCRDTSQTPEESFAARFLRFKLFLSAYLEAYGEILSFEERLADGTPVGMPFLRACMARLTVASMQCISQLHNLGGERFATLDTPFVRLCEGVQKILAKGLTPLVGPLIIPYSEADIQYASLIAPYLLTLRSACNACPEYIPKGFVFTGAAWWLYFNNQAMHEEIDRIMLISQEDPGTYSEAAATIRERIATSFPLPQELEVAVRSVLDEQLPELDRPGHVLLVRCMPVQPEHGALVMPEQVLRTPLDLRTVLKALRTSLGMAYRARSMIYRLKRGIRDRAMPLCIAVTLLPETHSRGSAHFPLEKDSPGSLVLRIRRGFTTPESLPLQASVQGASLPEAVRTKVVKKAHHVLAVLGDVPEGSTRHEISWAASEQGAFYLLGASSLPFSSGKSNARCDSKKNSAEKSTCLCGGLVACPGTAQAKVTPVRNFTDALFFPIGNILLLRAAAPSWSFLLDFASGAVAEEGTGNGLFARTARRYGRPTILGHPRVYEKLDTGRIVRMEAKFSAPTLTCLPHGKMGARTLPHPQKNEKDGRINICHETNTKIPSGASPPPTQSAPLRAPSLWLHSSDIANMARELIPLVVSLTLPDSDDLDFRAKHCATFHDLLHYCQVQAVREMFRSGTARKNAQGPAKQLLCNVPKQFWVIDLDDGLYHEVKGSQVSLDQIASIPMRALWEGFVDKPWDGPPQINARGFLSVLFEATANPNLDPASQSTHYTEKNVFLIARRFCSMRCRFGFHYLSVDCLLGDRPRERFIIFQFKGGAASLDRRIRRVHFVAELLTHFDFVTEISGDTLTARMEQGAEKKFISALRVVGYISMHTRQLDMIMDDGRALTSRRLLMLEDMLALATR